MNNEQINPAFWLEVIRTNAYVTDCSEKSRALVNAAEKLGQYIAALAPPSGEGVDWQAMADAIAYAPEDVRDAARLAYYRLRSPTTPQSAPVDGEFVLVPREPTEAMLDSYKYDPTVPCDRQARIRSMWWHMLAAAPTPPPASQERGGDIDLAIAVMNAADAYERTMQNYHDGKDRRILRGQLKLLRDFYAPIIEASNAEAIAKRDASPPSSAAEGPKVHTEQCDDVNFNLPHDSTAICVCAAEQAKPIGDCEHRWAQTSDDNVMECFYCGALANAAPEVEPMMKCICPPGAGCTNKCDRGQLPAYVGFDDDLEARSSVVPLHEELEIEAALLTNPHKAKRLREAAAIVRSVEQAQVGELPPLPEPSLRFCSARQEYVPDHYTADQMRDYGNACRLAGGVTVDDAAIHRATDAYATSLAEQYGQGKGNIVAMRAAVAALGAK